jgi:hypothetical protein
MSIKGLIRHPEAPPGVTNDETSVDLRQRTVNAAYLLRMEGTVGVTGGTGAGTVVDDSVYRPFRRLALNAADFDFQSITGRALYLEHAFMNLSPWPQTPIADLSDGASNDVVANILLPGQMLWTLSPDEFGIPTQLLDSPRLVLNMLDAEEMVTGNDGALAFTSGPTFTLYEVPYMELQERGISPAGFLGVRRKTVVKNITQAGDVQVVLSHLGAGHDLRAVIVNALEADADGKYSPSDTLIEQVRGPILGGVPKFEQNPWDVYQDKNVSEYQLDAVESGAIVLDSAEDKRTDLGQMWKVPMVKEDPTIEMVAGTPSANGARVEITTISVKRPGRGNAR